MRLDFYYWSHMCPLNCEMISLLQEYGGKFDIRLHDISGDFELAKSLKMYYPTMTVEGGRRYYSPFGKKFLDALLVGDKPEEKAYAPAIGRAEAVGRVVPITRDNYYLAGGCIGRSCSAGFGSKVSFLEGMGLKTFGFINIISGAMAGGAEYVPSIVVPYDIPRGERTAFITCVYRTDSLWDYKSPSLRALEDYLAHDFDEVYVISDEKGVFPNGDMEFFASNNYKDNCVVFDEPGYCRLHLMSKSLWKRSCLN
ncbi:MAG: hypothetical protein VB078_04220 [Clostridiaceae bacterium]|nr:hypothetical protein [Clostridiaceae bacterium]